MSAITTVATVAIGHRDDDVGIGPIVKGFPNVAATIAGDSASTFGTVNVDDSSEVHFGNKTYINGPVTIKQFINGNKTCDEHVNAVEEHDNFCKKLFVSAAKALEDPTQNNGNSQGRDPQLEDSREISFESSWPCKGIYKKWRLEHHSTKIIAVALVALIMLAILLVILYSGNTIPTDKSSWQGKENLVQNEPIETDIGKVLIDSHKLRMISRLQWLAQPPTDELTPLHLPVPHIIIAHTATESCSDQAACTFHVRYVQTYHIESLGWSDIGYNFMIGGDGAVYVCRGWDKQGAHTFGHNSDSIGIALIGTFNSVLPPERQLTTAKLLIQEGVRQNKVAKDYKLFGHRQFIPSLSPGDELFAEIKKWPHFSNST